VLVDVRAAADRVTFIVSDTGPGIPEEHLPHIFDRFYQVRATGRAGAGLGLAISRGLVEAHGSTLEVDSRPGEGTTFAFDLKRVRKTPTPGRA
jgi:two-component system sensor histidine kinase BaeS